MEEKKKESCADRLRQALDLRGMKQVDLIEKTGINKGAMSCYLSGKYEPKQFAVNKMALALDVSEMWLWGYDVPIDRPEAQKKNDKLVEIVALIKNNAEFFNLVSKIAGTDKSRHDVISKILDLNDDQFDSIVHLLNAFLK